MNLPFDISIPSIGTLDPSVVQALLIFAGVFIAAILIGFSRHYFVSSTLKGVWAGFVMGALAFCAVTTLVVWGARNYVFGDKAEALPDNFKQALAGSKENITGVLGIQTERPRPSAQTVVSDYRLLAPLDAELVRDSICRVETPGGEESD